MLSVLSLTLIFNACLVTACSLQRRNPARGWLGRNRLPSSGVTPQLPAISYPTWDDRICGRLRRPTTVFSWTFVGWLWSRFDQCHSCYTHRASQKYVLTDICQRNLVQLTRRDSSPADAVSACGCGSRIQGTIGLRPTGCP